MIRKPEKGTGFDNFIPKDLDKNSESDAGSSTEAEGDSNNKKKQDSSTPKNKSTGFKIDLKNFRGDGGGGGGGGDKKNNNNTNFNSTKSWIFAAFLLGMAYWMTLDDDDDEISSDRSGMQREIAWSDFLRLLQQQDIQKVVIASSKEGDVKSRQARVYLKPNATGLAHHRGGTASLSFGTTDASSTPQDHSLNDDNNSNNGLTLSHNQHQPNTPFYYRLAIGSLESFERKLDESQRRLGRPPEMDVPIQYTAEAVWRRELVGIVPGLIFALSLYAMMRFGSGGGFGASGGGGRGGGGGGAGGIFSIGKSTAKKIAKEDISVTFAQVAGCDEAKREIMEFVDFLKDSDRFTKLGATMWTTRNGCVL